MSFGHRPAAPSDAAAVAELLAAYDAAYQPDPETLGERDILEWWGRPDRRGGVVVVGEDGRIIGVGALVQRGDGYHATSFTHPDARGRGVGSFLLDWAERNALAGGVTLLRVSFARADSDARVLLESRGFSYARSFYRMSAGLDDEPAAPSWPQGFALSTLHAGDERPVHAALEEAFEDHWDHHPRSFEEWSALLVLEPDLCFVVRDREGSVVAAELCREERFGVGWVDVLGVRRAWRRHGLGEALLRHAFRELYARGRRRVGLGVDASNETGATRLYERVGMRPSAQEDVYEKHLSLA